MDIKHFDKGAFAILAVLYAGSQAFGQGKPLPTGTYPGEPLGDAGMELSGPALDGPQAFDLTKPLIYRALVPCRLADTRQPDVINPAFGVGDQKGFWGWAGADCGNGIPDDGIGCYAEFGGSETYCGIPSNAAAVHVNVSVVSPQGIGFMRIWPNNNSEPNATVFSWQPGYSMTNALTLTICSDATEDTQIEIGGVLYPNCSDGGGGIVDFWVRIYSQFPENIVIDALGYYEPLEDWTPINP